MPNEERINQLTAEAIRNLGISEDDSSYFVFTDTINNMAYKTGNTSINVLMKDGSLQDIAIASDNSNLEALSKTVTKNILCYTKF
jgi:hypothetical protein